MARRTALEATRTRSSILRAAARLFAEEGFSDTSLEEIAQRSRVTKDALYRHLADKRAIFAEVFGALDRELDAASRAAAMAAAARPREAFPGRLPQLPQFAQRPDFHRIVLVDGPSVLGRQPSKPVAVLLFGAR